MARLAEDREGRTQELAEALLASSKDSWQAQKTQ